MRLYEAFILSYMPSLIQNVGIRAGRCFGGSDVVPHVVGGAAQLDAEPGERTVEVRRQPAIDVVRLDAVEPAGEAL